MDQTIEFIGKSKNGISVFVDPLHSHAVTHLKDTPHLKELVIEAISNLELRGKEVARHVEMGRFVGICDVVKVGADDTLIYGVRKNRDNDGLVPFVKNREGDPCSYVALHIVPLEDKTYLLSSAWIGLFGGDDEPFPQSPDATPRSVAYWNKHAFIYGSQEIMAGTETPVCPW